MLSELIPLMSLNTCFSKCAISASYEQQISIMQIFIDSPNEYLTSISGTVGSFAGSDVVMSLCFQTNQKRYGPYGSDKGTHFSFDGKGGVIVGFHGRFGSFIDAIGIYLMPKSLAFDRHSTREESITNEVCYMASNSSF